jgi:hypothetical protein
MHCGRRVSEWPRSSPFGGVNDQLRLYWARHEHQMGVILFRRLNDVNRLLVVYFGLKVYGTKIRPVDQKVRQRL